MKRRTRLDLEGDLIMIEVRVLPILERRLSTLEGALDALDARGIYDDTGACVMVVGGHTGAVLGGRAGPLFDLLLRPPRASA